MNQHRRLWLDRAARLGAAAFAGGTAWPAGAATGACTGLLSHALRPLAGSETHPLCDRFADQVLLFVNTASKCGFTPQFDDLDTLHDRYRARGFSVLGFPSDDFRQELASEAEVAAFCELNYGVDFPMFQKVTVRGAGAHPLYRALAEQAGGAPDWNFNKYLVARDGRVIARYGSVEQPLGPRLVADIEALL